MSHVFQAVISFDDESQSYVGFIPALPGAHSCGDTLEELRANLKEAAEPVLEEMTEQGAAPATDVRLTIEVIEIAA